jgi:histidine triad (HIT) family protein
MPDKTHPVLDALKKYSQGLRYTSETDAPLEPFVWPAGKLTEDTLREQAGADKGAAVEETTLEGFFRAVPPEDQAKFQALAKALQSQLTDIKVYKIGDEPEKQAFIVGKAPDRRWAGLKTSVVET